MLSAGFLVDIMTHGIMGISKVCSVGNKIDVDECDLLPWLIEDKDTAVIGLYLESLLNGRRFIDICRNSTKPIVVLKGGKSAKGAQAAMSHTASLAGNERITQGAFAQAGVVEASDFKQMMDLCRTLSMFPPRREDHPGRVAILTFSGGAGIVSADFLEAEGLEVADLSEQTKESLGRLFPEWMPVSNPVDLWPALERHAGGKVDVISQALTAVLADSRVDAILLHAFVGNFRILFDINDLAQQINAAHKPAFIWLLGKREEAFNFYNEARTLGIPVFSEIGRAIECMAAVFKKREY
jgi:acetyltransferase